MRIVCVTVAVLLTALIVDAGHHGGNGRSRSPVGGDGDNYHYYQGPVHIHNHMDSGESSEEVDGVADPGADDDERVWTFHVAHQSRPWEYIDPEGHVKGYHIDLIQEVCRRAGKRCHYIADSPSRCWDTSGDIPLPGVGLLSGWYDGCLGLAGSPERLNSFNFTLAFTPNIEVAVHYRVGEIPHRPYNLTGHKIGFVNGWPIGKECLARTARFRGTHPGEYIPVVYEKFMDMLNGMRTGEIDVLLFGNHIDEARRRQMGLEPFGPTFSCTSQGASVMARYGSPLIDWWNDAFQEFVDSGEFATFCSNAKETHGRHSTVICLGDLDN